VKSYDLPDVMRALTLRINDKTIVMPLLNGVDICERIRDILDKGIVLPACVYVGTHIDKPGVVSQKGGDGVILCGADPQRPGFVQGTLIDFFGEAGIRFEWRDDPYTAIWEKYLFIASFGLVTVLSGKTLGGVFTDEALRALVRGIMNEIVSIAKKKGIDLAEDVVAVSLARAGNFPFDAKTSFQRDVEKRGGRNEGDLFGSTIIRMGGALGVETPITQSVYKSIQNALKATRT
jgi:2-dehydropantoate 2-reductase